MADHIYEAALPKTTGAVAGAIASIVPATLASGVRMPSVREIGIFSNSGVAAEIGIGYPAALGTGSISASATVQALNPIDAAGHTQLVTAYATTQPTAPSNYFRRAEIPAVVGAGLIWTWNAEEWQLWSGATISAPVIFQISALAVTFDVYIKVAE